MGGGDGGGVCACGRFGGDSGGVVVFVVRVVAPSLFCCWCHCELFIG